MNILLIETATAVCSVALVEIAFTPNGQPALHLLAERSSTSAGAHSTHLPIIIKDMLALQAQQGSPLDAVCVSAGPGSYTGLRIGVSSAKGLCYALGVPLLSVPTLQSMAALYYHQHPDYRGIVCPMIDARRMECYTLIASRQGVTNGSRVAKWSSLAMEPQRHARCLARAPTPFTTQHSPSPPWVWLNWPPKNSQVGRRKTWLISSLSTLKIS